MFRINKINVIAMDAIINFDGLDKLVNNVYVKNKIKTDTAKDDDLYILKLRKATYIHIKCQTTKWKNFLKTTYGREWIPIEEYLDSSIQNMIENLGEGFHDCASSETTNDNSDKPSSISTACATLLNSITDSYDLNPPDNENNLFGLNTGKRITNFFGKKLVDSLEELNKFYQGNLTEPIPIEPITEDKKPGAEKFKELIDKLNYLTPKDKKNQPKKEKQAVEEIIKTAEALKKELQPTTCWPRVKKWVLRIWSAILLAAHGVFYGAEVGAAAGAIIGGGIFSVPAATIGGACGSLVGGGLGLWGGHKVGKWVSHLDPTIAKADHSATIYDLVSRCSI